MCQATSRTAFGCSSIALCSVEAQTPPNIMTRLFATVAVLAHLIISLLHGRTHTELGVGLNSWQQTYVIVVILVAPLVALALVWSRHSRLGLLLLVASMAGSLVFGAYFHYVAISPDHVSHLPPGDAQGMFRVTAMLLAVTEILGLVVGLLGLRRFQVSPQV